MQPVGLTLIRAEKQRRNKTAAHWSEHLPAVYPSIFDKPFADYHAEMWDWAWAIKAKQPAQSFISIWPRGGGKSTNAEIAAIELGAQKKRRYCWYVRETQDQSDKSIENVQSILEMPQIAEQYPSMHNAAVSRIGRLKAWRRNRLMTESGYIVDGMGLDKAVRGIKSVEQRPDLIIFDDIDGRHDTIATTKKKIEIITQSIIPAGSTDVIVLFIQNLLVPDGVMAQIADGRADFLLDRIVSGPHPAANNLAYEMVDGKYKVVSGEPTWPGGYGLDVIERNIGLWGPTAFEREAQHSVEQTGGMYDNIEFKRCSLDKVPDLIRVVIWCDPAVTSTDKSDSMGIQCDGIDEKGIIYRLYSWEQITTPEDVILRALRIGYEKKAQHLGVETDQGGDLWLMPYNQAVEVLVKQGKNRRFMPAFKQDKAGAGYGNKVHRGQQMLYDYEVQRIVHVLGTHKVLEKALLRFPNKPLDLADAAWWSWQDLRKGGARLPKQQTEKSKFAHLSDSVEGESKFKGKF
jgi:hypothetical protein